MRKIPSTMATQHPDNASAPYWHERPYLSVNAELEECFRCYSELGIQEYNWDWEGKFVDEAVIDRLYNAYGDFFQKHPLGKDFFLTFRIANPRVEKHHRVGRAFMVMLTAAHLARQFNFYSPPLFEVILPLTETSEELIDLKEAFRELVGLKHKLLSLNGYLDDIEMIPLFEQVEKMMSSEEVLEGYISLHKQKFGYKPAYMRPYCARSDPALNSGLVPTVLAIKVALSSYLDFEKKEKIRLYPILGTGSLPFRGGLNPHTVSRFLKEYKGIRTAVIQSAFRYDYSQKEVIGAIQKLNSQLPKSTPKHLNTREVRLIREVIPLFTKNYRQVIEKLGTFINEIALQVPRRRERHQHIGLFGYCRALAKIRLPRAIPFTACFYSLGVPPELIGMGRGIKEAKESGLLSIVEQTYEYLKEECLDAGYFLNHENLESLAQTEPAFRLVLEDVCILEKYLGTRLGPKDKSHKEHFRLTSLVYEKYKRGENIQELIGQTGVLRKSLG